MKKLILLQVIMLSGSVLLGCHIAPPADRACTPIQQYYQGTLPGENREDIENSLFLTKVALSSCDSILPPVRA